MKTEHEQTLKPIRVLGSLATIRARDLPGGGIRVIGHSMHRAQKERIA